LKGTVVTVPIKALPMAHLAQRIRNLLRVPPEPRPVVKLVAVQSPHLLRRLFDHSPHYLR